MNILHGGKENWPWIDGAFARKLAGDDSNIYRALRHSTG